MSAKPLPPIELLFWFFDLQEPDGTLVWKRSARKNRIGKAAGWTMNDGYIHVRVPKHGLYLAHRLIMAMRGTKIDQTMFVDHINGVRHDNRAVNLRLVTRLQNAANRLPNKNTATGLQGVTLFYARDGAVCYRARIKREGKTISLGLHKTAKDAHVAYVAARRAMSK